MIILLNRPNLNMNWSKNRRKAIRRNRTNLHNCILHISYSNIVFLIKALKASKRRKSRKLKITKTYEQNILKKKQKQHTRANQENQGEREQNFSRPNHQKIITKTREATTNPNIQKTKKQKLKNIKTRSKKKTNTQKRQKNNYPILTNKNNRKKPSSILNIKTRNQLRLPL